MAALRFFLLGAPRLEQQHQSINLSRRKAFAALAYLVVTRQPHSRDKLATLLWPDQDQSGARANLRRDLSTLKQILGDQTLLVDQSLVSLNPDADLWSDVDEFQARLAVVQQHPHTNGHWCVECAAALKAAVDLYRADFMAGFSLPDSPEFDEWQFFETERLRHLLADALQRLIGWHTNRAEYEAAIAYARRWLALDALHEPAHRQLMRLYAWAGQHAAALRQYQECARLLEEELGAPPDAETTALHEAIRTKQVLPPATEREGAPAAAAEPEPRERYQTERLLEVGGYGEVYLGRDSVTGRAVVIKRLKPELVAQDPAFVARFVREAQALRQLNHPNIVAILATIEQDGEQRIVMEYVPGGTLRDLLEKEGLLSSERVLAIALELADALSRAHHLHIIHRDLKPDNVLLAADGTPRLMDFGMARLTQDDEHLTQPGMIVGSPAYLSPEALRGEEPDARSDIWSFGVLLYELLAGHPPFDGQQLMTVLSNIMHAPVPDITDTRSDVPPALVDLLQRMLTKEREERIASMRLVAAELEAIRTGRPLKRSTPVQAATVSSVVEVMAPSTPAASQRQWEQSIRFCQSTDGVRLAYATVGSGPPLVKAANWLSHLEYDWQSPIWRHWLIGLAQQHTLIRYDERGCGLSDWDVADISFEAWLRDLETVVEAAGVERFPLLGISKGGSIAIAYAARHPEKVSHLILYGAYARGRLIRNPELQQAEEAELTRNLIRIGWGRENPAFRQVFASTFLPDGTQEQQRWFNELQRVSASPENAARIYAGSNLTDVRDVAARLHVPTLVLHARGDMRVPFEEGRLLASLIPGARLVPLDSNNHILLEDERAWPQFLNEVTQFTQTEPEPAVTISSAMKVGTSPVTVVPPRELEQSIRFCQSADGVRLAYATSGDGPPLVKAANWLSHLEFDWHSPIWRHWLIGLAQQNTLIRYDERGCGLSDWNVDDFSLEAWVRDLEAVVDAVGVERFPLLGLSQGGPIAIAYAMRHPERVSHLILYGSYARGKRKRNLTADQIDEVEAQVKLIQLGWGRDNPAFRQVFTSMFIPEGTSEQYHWFDDLMRASASSENAARLFEGFNTIEVSHLAAQVNIPTLVLHARGDMRIPFAEGRRLASLIPGARLIPLDSNNHILLEHEPAWQKFLSEVHEFLASPDRSIHRRASAHPLDAPAPDRIS
jgi:serine/threonine protein kinase/DNA-binding SARP family transcriptional activator/alpha-beta hydrolase superfamily lysophospholipase